MRHNVLTEGWNISGSGNSIVRNEGGRWHVDGEGHIVRSNRITHGLVLAASGTLVRDNTVSNSANPFGPEPDGIFVPAGATDNALVGNSASGTGDDGIDVEEPSTTLGRNRAFANADLGIEAVAGVIDAGDNRAWDNGNPPQCLNVDCQ